jgi:hypothetical protein
MGAAHDTPQINAYSIALGHVPMIGTNPRRGEKNGMDPAHALHFRNRHTAEHVNSNLKDSYGGRVVGVHGAAKVITHMLFG